MSGITPETFHYDFTNPPNVCVYAVFRPTKLLARRSIERTRSWYGTFACPICRSSHVSSGDTVEWIGMPFGVVNGVGLRRVVLDFGGVRRR